MSSNFVHLHVHSHYSLLDGLAKIPELLDEAKRQGMESLAITDHGAMYGVVEFYLKAKEVGIKPIIGVETYLAANGMANKRAGVDRKSNHLVLIAKNFAGYQNLMYLTSQAHLKGYYYKPRIDKELLRTHSDGLIALTSCLQGEIPAAIANGDIKKAERLLEDYLQIFGEGNVYMELQDHPNIAKQKIANEGIVKLAQKFGLPLLATNDVHYVKREDAEPQDILVAIQTKKTVHDTDRLSMVHSDFSLRTSQDMENVFTQYPEAIKNTKLLAEQVNLELPIGQTRLPYYEVPKGKTSESYLRELVQAGVVKRFGTEQTKRITDRIDYELSVIEKTGFASYFLIVQDVVNWAKNNGIVVGPGRGSAAGSLVSYVLNITNVNPLDHDLLFERFLNPQRISMPDIDLDFTDLRRDEVLQYVAEKFGRDRVAQIITFGTMAARAAIRDVGRALGYEYSLCDKLAKLVPFQASLEQAMQDSLELRMAHDTDPKARRIITLAKKLEGVARHASTHACGVVITEQPLVNYTPLQFGTTGERSVITQFEMKTVEKLGLLKMDFLGLRNLTIIEETLANIKNRHNIDLDIHALPLNDKNTFKLLQQGNAVGIFQLESDGMRGWLKELKPTELNDIIAMVALYRPGPMELIPNYVARKHGKEEVKYLHPKLEPILKNTYGIMVYQEQLLLAAQALAGFTLSEADILRKAVGKKIRDLMLEQKAKLITGMTKNGIPDRIAKQFWQLVEPFDRYGFNKSHAVCYALIGYQTAYLKAHYPTEFFTALLNSRQGDIEKVAFFIADAKRNEMKVLPPDINQSHAGFTAVEGGVIRFGLNAIKNVGENIVKAIIDERAANGAYSSIDDVISRVKVKDLNKKSLERLIKSAAFNSLAERNQLLHNMDRLLRASP